VRELENFGCPGANGRNSVWLNFFCADHLWERDIVDLFMRSVFVTLPETEQVFFALPSDTPMFAPLKETLKELHPIDGAGERMPFRVFTR
jgi:hypothetical protein